MRTAAFSNKTFWNTLTERTMSRFDREGVERYVCQWKEKTEGADKSSRVGKSTLHIKHTTKAVTTAPDPHCESQSSRTNVQTTAAHVQIVPQRRITSSRGNCKTDRSHMTWALEEITYPTSCNLCAIIWRVANVLHTCSPDAPPSAHDHRESACPACSTTQTPQATLKIWR